ncbi:MAG: D-cysteine desulfhydrase family protein [Chloroflexota bacterium]|nr:MAG: D-cysteine desulfhydrase family protein [Chloroflexota bacterium]
MLSKIHIAHLPTHIDKLPILSNALGGPRLLVKRDDQTGLVFGGNKTRKLEYLLAQARDAGARTLITTGAGQSNHCRQTASAAARFGFDCTLVLAGQEPETASANLFLDRLVGAEIVWTTPENRAQTIQKVFKEIEEAGRKPFLIPYGGSSKVGAAAYALAVQELLGQLPKQPDWIVFASSSGGTQAGLVAGASLFGLESNILGISVDEPKDVLQSRVAELASEVTEILGQKMAFSPNDILVNADYTGAGYGVMGTPEREAIHLFAKKEGILLDPVYTGRAAAGLIDLIRKGFFGAEETVLFWHTGGTPALFANKYQEAILRDE